MTVSSTTSRVVYSGNGATTVWPFNFKVATAADLVVIYTDTTGTDFTLSTSQYTATGFNLDAGGNVTYPTVVSGASPIATGTKLTIYRSVALTQPASISNQGAMWPQVIEAALDRLTYMAQAVSDAVSRALVISPTDSTAINNLPNATERANSFLAFDATGQPIAATSISITAVTTWLATNFLLVGTSAATALAALGGLASSLFTTRGDILVRGASVAQRLAVGTNGQVLTSNGTDPAWATPATVTVPFPGARQTVPSGPVDTAGLPTFFAATFTGLTITAQNISASYPLVATAANGWSATTGLPVDTVGYSSTNPVWPAATINRAATAPNFAYLTIAAGVLTPFYTLLAPIYQWGGTPATTSGQFTFNISEMRGYLGNGSTAPQTNAVFVGEVATNGTDIISTVCYAYNGGYEKAFTATLPAAATAVSFNHNIGVPPCVFDFRIRCNATEAGYAAGDILSFRDINGDNSAQFMQQALEVTSKAMSFIANSPNPYWVINKGTAARTALTLAKWDYAPVARRGWGGA